MPNLKIYVDESVWREQKEQLRANLLPLRELLCASLKTDASVCQFAVIPIQGMEGQADVAVELKFLPKPERTREMMVSVCTQVREFLSNVTGCKTVVRAAALDPLTYVVVR